MTESDPLPDFARNELIPVIAQDAASHQVLMMAYMNAEAFAETVRSGFAVYYSRSRGRLWRKGEESGHRQHVISMHVDCDGDTLLLQVNQHGAACHTGYRTCFFRRLTESGWKVSEERLVDPHEVYRSPQGPGTVTQQQESDQHEC